MLLRPADAHGDAAPLAEQAGVEQAGDVARRRPGRSRCGPPASRPRPAAPARTGRASRCARSRRSSPRRLRLATERRRDLVGADGDAPRRRAGRRGDASSRRLRRQRRRAARSSSRPTSSAVEHRRRRRGAEAEAIDRLERDRAVAASSRRSRCRASLQRAPARRSPPIAWQASARQSLTHMAAGRLAAEVVVEGDDAVHLGARQVQRLGDERHRRLRHVAEGVLQRVQDRQQRAFAMALGAR